MIVTAGFDPIRDDGLDYAARLRAADVPVQLLHYQGQFHGFLNFDSINGAGRDALQRIGDALREAFGRQPIEALVHSHANDPGQSPAGQIYISRATCHGIGRLHDAKNFKLTQ